MGVGPVVEPKHAEIGLDARVHIQNYLILLEDGLGKELIDDSEIRIGPHARQRGASILIRAG